MMTSPTSSMAIHLDGTTVTDSTTNEKPVEASDSNESTKKTENDDNDEDEDDSDDKSGDDTNPYLALRAAKIARNQAKLNELGFSQRRAQQINPKQVAAREKRRLAALEPPQRRSRRLIRGTDRRTASVVDDPSGDTNEESQAVSSTSPSSSSPPRAIEKIAARDIELNRDQLIARFLGETLSSTGKAYCMQECAKLANESRLISFNKYSGIQPWKNVVFLWINLHVPGSQNKFLPSHRVTFYGGKRMVDESPIIQRLKRDANGGVVLWCREYNPDTKTFHPYFCMGRLSVS